MVPARFLKRQPFEPPVPPPEGWQGEPWEYPKNVEIINRSFQSVVRWQLVVGLIAGIPWFIGSFFASRLSGVFMSLFTLGYVIQLVLIWANPVARLHDWYYRGHQHRVREVRWSLLLSFFVVSSGPMVFWTANVGIGSFLLESLFRYVPLVVGSMLIAHGIRRHEKGTPTCSACGYDLSDLDDAQRCPECGAALKRLFGIKFRRPIKGPRLAIAGGVIMLMLLLVPVSNIVLLTSSSTIARALPTPILHAVAPHQPSMWAEVERRNIARPLTRPEVNELAERAIDNLRRNVGKDYHTGTWIEKQFDRGLLDTSLIERYFSHAFELVIAAPEIARIGEPTTIRVEGKRRYTGRHAFIAISIRGYRIDGGEYVGGSDASAQISAFEPGSPVNMSFGPPDSWAYRWTPASPGTKTIEVSAVAFVTNMSPITGHWDENGQYNFNGNPGWSSPITLTRTITVTHD